MLSKQKDYAGNNPLNDGGGGAPIPTSETSKRGFRSKVPDVLLYALIALTAIFAVLSPDLWLAAVLVELVVIGGMAFLLLRRRRLHKIT